MDDSVLVYGIKTKSELDKLLEQQTLIAKEASLEGVYSWSPPSALYFGVGLCNGLPFLTQGLPIDVLSMILISGVVADRKYVLIADSHARVNGFDEAVVQQRTQQYKELIEKTLLNLGLEGWSIVLASEIERQGNYQHALSFFSEFPNYEQRELADMLWFQQEHSVSLKVGWALSGTRRRDEVFFDKVYKNHIAGFKADNANLSFLYVISGKTFDPLKPHCAPYFCPNRNARILLEKDENVASKVARAKCTFGESSVKEYMNYLKAVVRLYETVIEPIERGPTETKLQQIIERCTQ